MDLIAVKKEMKKILQETISLINYIVAEIQAKNFQKALTDYVGVIGVIEELINLKINLSTLEKVEETEIETLRSVLKEVVNALENADFVLFGDLLEYELIPILEKWAEVN
ncbi:hypothetical protein [Carboxydothermus pertinax]|uniref:DUF8042 domain-containing protein n=1 Tax=Carboxydothermus pertinax TaxID=870242 RepID=A0A1L8CUG5_9THEO|nr:hypothetical protein [Carboxydothermus pertinax]GAV22542.1 hypothetical protein cpu_10520 [Carboxydothermus pertinax]